MSNPVFKSIIERRSVREFLERKVEDKKILEILNAGRWSPSGLNTQAWRFIVVKNRERLKELSELTVYGKIIEHAPICIAVFLDGENVYDWTRDIQSAGACIQNMLLAAHSLNLGAVWLGEILKNKDKVKRLLEAPESFELMAVVAVGYPEERRRASTRRPLTEIAWLDRYGNRLDLETEKA